MTNLNNEAMPLGQEATVLSFTQERVWLLSRVESDRSALSQVFALQLQGALDADALGRALATVGLRHRVLRSAFPVVNGVPVRVDGTGPGLRLEIEDLSTVREPEVEAVLHGRLVQLGSEAFDLEHGPCLRAVLFRLAGDLNVLAMVVHAIAGDALILPLLAGEIADQYDVERGVLAPSDDVPVQYERVAERERAAHSEEKFAASVDYFSSMLRGAPVALALPTDRPRPPVQTFAGARCTYVPAPSVSAFLEAEGADPAVSLLTVLAVFYARYTGQRDVVLGFPLRVGPPPDACGVVGPWDNLLPLRIDVDLDEPASSLRARVARTVEEARAHGDLPFAALLDAVKPRRDLSHAPIFQAAIAVDSGRVDLHTRSGLSVRILEIPVTTTRFEVTLRVERSPEGIRLGFEYNTSLFERATAARMLGHLATLLDSMADQPDGPVGRLRMIGDAERNEILRATSRGVDPSAGECCLHEWFERQAERTPGADAAVFNGTRISYRDLNARANGVARVLVAWGVGPGVAVGVCAERSFDLLIGLLGVLKAGGAYTPLDPSYPRDRLAYMLRNAEAPVLITHRAMLDKLPEHSARVLCLDGSGAYTPMNENPRSGARPDDLLYVLYTSGSTGMPKGVAMPHRALANLIGWQLGQSSDKAGRRTVQFSATSFDVSFQEIFATWCAGGTLVVVTEETRRDPSQLLALMDSERVERIFLPFVALQQLAEVAAGEGKVPSSLNEVITAGEQLRITPQIVQFFGAMPGSTLHNHYGPVESHVATAHTLTGDPAGWPTLPPIGRPVDNVAIHLLDRAGEPAPVGVPGEICLGGVALARGYFRRPELTAERFVPDPQATSPGGRVYRTGDLGRLLSDGGIEFLGRIDAQVKIRGFRVEPGEIESVLAREPLVRECAVIVREGPAGDKRLVAYVVTDGQNPMRAGELRAAARASLPDYMVPTDFVFISAMPLTPSGKIDRRALPSLETQRNDAGGQEYESPRTQIEVELVRIWEEIFGRKRIGIRDDFFDLGGHSLLAVRMFSQIDKVIGAKLALAVLFRTPTVELLAKAIEQESASSWSSVVDIQPRGTLSPVFWGHTLGGGGGGGLFRYRRLAALLGSEQPSYGIEAPKVPFDNIKAMAAHYVEILQSVQPRGPYYLAGYCFGGNVAFEMAQRLWAKGEIVAFLGLLESVPYNTPARSPWRRESLEDFAQNVKHWFEEFKCDSPAGRLERVRNAVHAVARAIKGPFVRSPGPVHPELADEIDLANYPKGYLGFAQTHWRALMEHVPGRYPGHIHLFRTRSQPLMTFDSTLGWSALAVGGVSVHLVRGAHESMLEEPAVGQLAEEFAASLDAARREHAGNVSVPVLEAF